VTLSVAERVMALRGLRRLLCEVKPIAYSEEALARAGFIARTPLTTNARQGCDPERGAGRTVVRYGSNFTS